MMRKPTANKAISNKASEKAHTHSLAESLPSVAIKRGQNSILGNSVFIKKNTNNNEAFQTGRVLAFAKKQKLFGLLLALFALSLSFNPNSSLAAETDQEASGKKWSTGLAISYYSELYSINNNSHDNGMEFGGSFSYKVAPKFTETLSLGFSQSLGTFKKALVNDISLSTSWSGLELHKAVRLSSSLSITIPFSKRSRKNDDLRTAFTLAPRFSFNLAELGIPKTSASLSSAYTRAIHKFRTRATGGPLKQNHWSNSLAVSYSPIDKLSLSVSGRHTQSWSYQGFQNASFNISQSASYQVHQYVGLSVAHSNGGDVQKADGQSSNVAFVDKQGSTYSATVSLAY